MPRILIVEDEPDIALGLEKDLTRHGYDVQTVGDGDEALRLASQEAWDLILLDVMLPKKDGFEVCQELRQAGLQTPIIMLTAKTHEAEKVLGLELGADDYITKPFSPRELRARIHAAIRRAGEPTGGTYRFGGHLTGSFGIMNAFDNEPPVDPISYAGVNYNPTYHQAGIIGRFWKLGLAYRF